MGENGRKERRRGVSQSVSVNIIEKSNTGLDPLGDSLSNPQLRSVAKLVIN